MSYEADLFVRACSDPNGTSDRCWPGGIPMTNREAYEQSQGRNDGWH